MSFRGLLAVILWGVIGMGVGSQLDEGTLIGTAWSLIWIGVFVIGIVAWNTIMKDD